MADTHETIADIIAEMRQGTRLPGFWRSCDLNKILCYHADRFEAAHKRECSDAAKLREAIKNSNGLLEELATIGKWGESAREQIAENNAALAAAGQKEGGTK